jgi:hypothetical protein
MARLTLRHRLAKLHPFVWIGAVAAVGALVAWPLGGWDTVELVSTRIPQVEPGTRVAGNQFSVTVEAVELTEVHPDGFTEPEPGWEFLIMDVSLVNETDATELSLYTGDASFGSLTVDDGVLGWGTTMQDVSGYVIDPDIYLRADGTFLPDLQPGLEAPLLMVWQVPVGTFIAGNQMTVGVVDRTPYQRTLGVGIGYRSPQVVATVELTIAQGALAPEPEPEPEFESELPVDDEVLE